LAPEASIENQSQVSSLYQDMFERLTEMFEALRADPGRFDALGLPFQL
jgi:hypothetical protein